MVWLKMGTNGEYINVRGSPVWSSQPITLLNGTITYPYLLQHKEDQERLAMLPSFSSLHDSGLSNHWWRTEDLQTSLDTMSDYRSRLCEIPTASTPVSKLQHIHSNTNTLPSPLTTPGPSTPNIYTGVIRNNHFDFITEEPYKKRLKITSGGTSDGIQRTHVLHDVIEGLLSSQVEPVITTSCGGPGQESVRLNQASDQYRLNGHSSLSATEFTSFPSSSNSYTSDYTNLQYSNGNIVISSATTSSTNNSTSGFTNLKYSLAGQSQPRDKAYFESLSSLETYVIERPGAESTSANVLPSGNTFSSPLDQYVYRGMTCYPFTYPAPLPPHLQYYPTVFPATDPYYFGLLRERFKDVAPYVYPTFIQPKPFTSVFPYRPIPETPLPSSLSYPNPAAMFRAANLIPPRMSSSTQPSASKNTNVSKSDSCMKAQDNCKAESRSSSQPTWLKTDNGCSYTVAAAPSEVMTYLPNSVNKKDNRHLIINSDSSIYDDDDNNDYMDGDNEATPNKKKPLISISSLLPKKESSPCEKKHLCTSCGKWFARAYTLKTHQRVHSGVRPYSCKICFKTFAQGGGLDSHMRTHTGEKPYECPVCGRSFSHSSALKSHHRRHTGEKPYRCNVCPKKFADQSTLTKHSRTHSGDRPYHCQICKMAFTQLGNMNKHVKTIHAKKGNKQMTSINENK